MKHLLKLLASFLVPHGVVVLASSMRRRWKRQARASRLQELVFKKARTAPSFDYEEAVDWLAGRGVDTTQVRQGSMPEASLHFCAEHLHAQLPPGPVLGLHVGNFVGLSLAYFVQRVVLHDPASRIVSIDPDVPHRGIPHPARHVLALLGHFGLEGNHLLLTGYTLEKNPSNDGFVFAGYDPAVHYASEGSCTHQLEGLALWSKEVFHFCVLDGNHDADYLCQELAWIERLLQSGALLFLDDVGPAWPEVKQVYAELGECDYETVDTDGRIGVLRKT